MRIFILDDEALRHDYFETKYAGHVCVHTYTGEEALTRLRSEPRFDVATLDHDLGPGIDGTEVAKTLVDPERFPPEKLPAVIVVHSFNYYRALGMVSLFQSVGIESRWGRFGY